MIKKSKKDLIPFSGSISSRIFGDSRFENALEYMDCMMNELIQVFPDWEVSVIEDLRPGPNFPKVNILENDDSYEVEIAVTGFDKDDVSLELKDNNLVIKAEKKKKDSGETDQKYLMKEIAQRSFRRVFRFPIKIDTENIKCSYENGIISCVIGKMKPNEPEIIKIDID
jgi:HSP20 family protein